MVRTVAMALLTTTEVGQLLGVSAATVKRLSVAGKIRCARSSNGTREFGLDDVAEHLGAIAGSMDDALRERSADQCVAVLVRACAGGASLAQAFDELVTPALARFPWDDLSFIARCEPLAIQRHARSSQPTAIVLTASPSSPRLHLATCLLRGLGYRVPSLSRDAQHEVLRVVACADPTLVVAVEPHRGDLAHLRLQLPQILSRLGGRLLVDGAGADFRTFQEFFERSRIRNGSPFVLDESVAVS